MVIAAGQRAERARFVAEIAAAGGENLQQDNIPECSCGDWRDEEDR